MDKELKQQIKDMTTKNKVFLFMKGEKDMPMCGFSRQVVTILNELDVEFKTFNILSDEKIRTAVKEYSSWPTYPQLYVNGEFVGGCDIVTEMFEEGELQKLFSKN